MDRQTQLRSAERTIERAQAKIDMLLALPDEPIPIAVGRNVVWFEKTFRNGDRTYTYAAVQAGDDLWYTTGPNTPKGFTWDELIAWITNNGSNDTVVYQAKRFRPLS